MSATRTPVYSGNRRVPGLYERTLADGWPSAGAREGRLARTLVFPFAAEWQGRVFAEEEVTVYFKVADGETVVFTAIARYGAGFPRGGVT